MEPKHTLETWEVDQLSVALGLVEELYEALSNALLHAGKPMPIEDQRTRWELVRSAESFVQTTAGARQMNHVALAKARGE